VTKTDDSDNFEDWDDELKKIRKRTRFWKTMLVFAVVLTALLFIWAVFATVFPAIEQTDMTYIPYNNSTAVVYNNLTYDKFTQYELDGVYFTAMENSTSQTDYVAYRDPGNPFPMIDADALGIGAMAADDSTNSTTTTSPPWAWTYNTTQNTTQEIS
jgi:hypothetical protein